MHIQERHDFFDKGILRDISTKQSDFSFRLHFFMKKADLLNLMIYTLSSKNLLQSVVKCGILI